MVGIAQDTEEHVQKIEDFYTVRNFSGHRLLLSVRLRHYLVKTMPKKFIFTAIYQQMSKNDEKFPFFRFSSYSPRNIEIHELRLGPNYSPKPICYEKYPLLSYNGEKSPQFMTNGEYEDILAGQLANSS